MRRVSLVFILLFAILLVLVRAHLIPSFHAPPQVATAAQASKEVGHYATITGRVADVTASQRGTVFIDIGGHYPNQEFTAMIPSGSAGRFVALSGYRGLTVAVTGRVDLYHGKPEIVVRSPDQLKLSR